MRKILAVSAISIGLFVAGLSLASAQSLPAICSVLPVLRQGSNGPSVTILQQFLGSQGYLSVPATGFFGPLTEAALVKFQDATGISGQAGGNGIFGPFTRAYIVSHYCTGGTIPTPPNQGGLLTVNITSGLAPLTVTFSGIGSSITFGDGTSQSSQNGSAIGTINHTYTAAGNYIATSGNLQVTISVSGNAMTPAGSISSFTNSGPAPLSVTFYVSCINASTYDVTYGDGTDLGSSNAGQVQCNGSLESFTHTYTTAGSYTATLDLIQQQSNGTFVSQTAGSVGITATGPTTAITLNASPTSGSAPLAVTFTAQGASVSQTDTITFGDGSTGALSSVVCNSIAGAGASCSGNATHTYTSAGTFPVKLLGPVPYCPAGTSNCTAPVLGTASVTVSGGNGFTANPSAGTPPLAVQFAYTITSSQLSNTYSINFGDGQSGAAQTGCATDGGGGCLASASHTYTATGTYPAIISSSGTNLATTTVSVGTCVVPTQNLSLGNSDADSNGQVSVLQTFLVFEGSTIYPAQLVTGFFGNGTLTGVRNFQAIYGIQQTGFVGPLTLAAMSQACSGIAPPTSSNFSFTASPSSGSAPLAVTFTAKNAETSNSGSYVVAFGDGSQSAMSGATSSMTVSHTYSQNGTYSAQLLIQQNLCGGVPLSGCVSDLQVGTTTVTVGNGVTPPGTAGSNTVYVYSSGTFGCDTTSQSTCSPANGNTSPAANSVLLETFTLFGSQQSGTIPLYVCSNGALGEYGAVVIGGNGGYTVPPIPSGQPPAVGGNYLCVPGYGASNGSVWGYMYQGPQSGSLPLYLLAFPDPGGADGTAYMMTTRPFVFGGINEGTLGYVPSATYPSNGSSGGGNGTF